VVAYYILPVSCYSLPDCGTTSSLLVTHSSYPPYMFGLWYIVASCRVFMPCCLMALCHVTSGLSSCCLMILFRWVMVHCPLLWLWQQSIYNSTPSLIPSLPHISVASPVISPELVQLSHLRIPQQGVTTASTMTPVRIHTGNIQIPLDYGGLQALALPSEDRIHRHGQTTSRHLEIPRE
jgi:hypothetical protein